MSRASRNAIQIRNATYMSRPSTLKKKMHSLFFFCACGWQIHHRNTQRVTVSRRQSSVPFHLPCVYFCNMLCEFHRLKSIPPYKFLSSNVFFFFILTDADCKRENKKLDGSPLV